MIDEMQRKRATGSSQDAHRGRSSSGAAETSPRLCNRPSTT
jgi:hypothetical protein